MKKTWQLTKLINRLDIGGQMASWWGLLQSHVPVSTEKKRFIPTLNGPTLQVNIHNKKQLEFIAHFQLPCPNRPIFFLLILLMFPF